jgi:hypothetical protein
MESVFQCKFYIEKQSKGIMNAFSCKKNAGFESLSFEC